MFNLLILNLHKFISLYYSYKGSMNKVYISFINLNHFKPFMHKHKPFVEEELGKVNPRRECKKPTLIHKHKPFVEEELGKVYP